MAVKKHYVVHVDIFIVTYAENDVLLRNVKSLLASDLFRRDNVEDAKANAPHDSWIWRFGWKIHIINNSPTPLLQRVPALAYY